MIHAPARLGGFMPGLSKNFTALLFSLFLCGATASAESMMIPGINLMPTVTEANTKSCSADQFHSMFAEDGKVIAQLCQRDYKSCLLEGGCKIISANGNKIASFIKYDEEKNLSFFAIVDTNRCPFGLGKRNICIDPYFSIAADRTQARLGDVIFVPALRGFHLPNGKIHDGYLIVRDFASANEGSVEGVMELQLGPASIQSKIDLREQLKFDSDHRFEYRKVQGAEADRVRSQRNFPLVPESYSSTEGIGQ
jgi:hypothetical protein